MELRETVKVTKFVLPPDAFAERNVAPVVIPAWERRVAAALWALAAAILATLYLVNGR